jgi:hypothetical protein
MLAFQAKTVLLVIPPIFILLRLLDVWVPRKNMLRLRDQTLVPKEPCSLFCSARLPPELYTWRFRLPVY